MPSLDVQLYGLCLNALADGVVDLSTGLEDKGGFMSNR